MAELNCNKRPTVRQVIEFLQQFPDHYEAAPYEGEGGDWIIVTEPESEPVLGEGSKPVPQVQG